MGGGVPTYTAVKETDSWRDFNSALEVDATRIRQDLERELREKQARQLLETHSELTIPKFGHESSSENAHSSQRSAFLGKSGSSRPLPAFARPLTVAPARRLDSGSSRGKLSELQVGQRSDQLVSAPRASSTANASRNERQLRETNTTTSENETPVLSPRETLEKKLIELTEMNLTVRRLQKEKESMTNELQTVRNHLNQYQTELRAAERTTYDSRSRADDVRSELRAIERKRDSAISDLNSMNGELDAKKQELRNMEQRLRKCVVEIEAFEALGISRDEIESMIEERNRLIEMVRENEQDSNVRYELEKQLVSTQEQARSLEQVRSVTRHTTF